MVEVYNGVTFEKMSIRTFIIHLSHSAQGLMRVPILARDTFETIEFDFEDLSNDVHTNFFLRRYLYDLISNRDDYVSFKLGEFNYNDVWRGNVTIPCTIIGIKPNRGLNSCLEVKTPHFNKSEGFLIEEISILTLLNITKKVLEWNKVFYE